MAYRLRVYAPTPGVSSMAAYGVPSGSILGYGEALGTGTPCIDITVSGQGCRIIATLESGYSVTGWVVSGADIETDTSTSCYIPDDDGLSNVFVRIEVTNGSVDPEPDPGTDTYYLTLNFNANGGTGAPGSVTGYGQTSNGYATATIPLVQPTRDGYTFAGWATNAAGTGDIRWPGGTYTNPGSTTPPYPSYTLYAKWTKEANTEGRVLIRGVPHIPMIWDGTRWLECQAIINTTGTAAGWKPTSGE